MRFSMTGWRRKLKFRMTDTEGGRKGGLTCPVRLDSLQLELLRQRDHGLVAAAATAAAAHGAGVVGFVLGLGKRATTKNKQNRSKTFDAGLPPVALEWWEEQIEAGLANLET
jgi:hypothetical protein